MEFFAKTFYDKGKKKGETLQKHTKELLNGLVKLKTLYHQEISKHIKNEAFWEDLKLIALFHDLGKISTPFQNKIRKALSLPALPEKLSYKEIPHNYISPAFITGIKNLKGRENEQRLNSILLCIAFHHERDLDFNESTLEVALHDDILPNLSLITDWLKIYAPNYQISEPSSFYFHLLREYLDGNNDNVNFLKKDREFIFLKGLLHRLDFSASAHLPVETERLGDTTEPLIQYLKQKHNSEGLKPYQEKAKTFRDSSIIATASTGIGKTEFALNWLGDAKGFYTLPLRVSTNAMHKRLTEIFGDRIGLLHSDSFFYEHENNNELSIEENIHRVNTSRQLSMPLTVTTADQLFTSVFKWPGYERIYATMAYSKIILDEPQGYSSKTLAMIIKCLQEVHKMGSKFCYMSATNHPFIINRIQEIAETLPVEFTPDKKHKLQMYENSIEQLSNQILERFGSKQKVLVICNTVKKSQEMYRSLLGKCNLNLLHSGFIKIHRDKKEETIQKDFKESKPVVWISTQIVEASLDIDYDVLFTEAATLDALVQRMGRIYRRPERLIAEKDKPNIVISGTAPSDNYKIYDATITKRSINTLKKFNGKILLDEEKQQLMNEVYLEEEIRETPFYIDFQKTYNLLDLGYQAANKNEAQKLFREISQIKAIPTSIYGQFEKKIETFKKVILNKKASLPQRLLANKELEKYSLSIPAYKNKGSDLLVEKKDNSIYLIPGQYDEFVGLQYDKIENIY